MKPRRIMAAMAMVGLLAGTASCASDHATSSGVTPQTCPVELDDEGSNDRVVIMSDRTPSRREADSGDGVVESILGRIAAKGPVVALGIYGGSDAEVTFSRCVAGHFRPNFNNGARRADATPELVHGAMQAYGMLSGDWSESDPTTPYRAGAEKFRGATEARTLVILTDGIGTAGCAALPDPTDPADLSQIDAVVRRCDAAGALPDLTGVTVHLIGIGHTNQPMTSESVTFLQRLNLALCTATGASCEIALDVPTNL